jgi:SAM-dependent methyltransferase
VDVVCDAADYRDEPFDVVVSTEMLEHCKRWEEVVRNMVALTRPGGLLLMTWASPGRGEHGTFRCSPGDSPHTNGHYRGISAVEFAEVARPADWAETFLLEDRADAGDVYFYGRKK